MNNSIEILKKINWFLEPVSNLILFLFSTKLGIFVFILGAITYIIVSTLYSINKNNSSSLSRRNLSVFEKFFIFIKIAVNLCSNIIVRAPLLLGIIIFLSFIVGISNGISALDNYLMNQKKIQELRSIVKMLDQSYQVAQMEVIDVDFTNGCFTTLKLQFFDYSNMGFTPEFQTIKIPGNDIYLDAIVMNFDYSLIETGTKKNIAIPYRIFSNVLPQKEGIELKLKDNEGVPVMFHRNDKDIYAMSSDTFSIRLKELFSYLTNEKKAREAGIRSAFGNAVHQYVFKGQIFTIWVEQTGGLIIKRKETF